MRHTLFATLMIFATALPAAGFEIESDTRFAAPSGTTRDEVSILSTADIDLFAPIVQSFQQGAPDTDVRYVSVSSSEAMTAVVQDGAAFDLVISSAMDLQTKLANDGYAATPQTPATDLVPAWGKWRNSVFAFTQEPAAIVMSRAALEGFEIPRTRQDLITLMRDNPERFRNRVGTYDVRDSGLGYLFATQDSRTSESYWRLTEVLGSLGLRLYCCSSQMIEDVSAGKLALAYNVLGSYAAARDDVQDRIIILELEDFTTLMLRSVLALKNAPNPEGAEAFLAHLLRAAWDDPTGDFPFPNASGLGDTVRRPIRLGPGLLVFLDRFKRAQFLQAWEDAVIQD